MAEENPNKLAHMGGREDARSSPDTSIRRDRLPSEVARESSGCYSGEALSNYVVLRNIFRNLDNNDVESCCQVNKCWNAVADPLFVRYYDVKLKTERLITSHSVAHRHYVEINRGRTYNSEEIRLRYSSERDEDPCYCFDDIKKFLETAMESEKIRINLLLQEKEWDGLQGNFVSKFGKLVEKVCFLPERVVIRLEAIECCQMLVRYFPNVKHLDLSKIAFVNKRGNYLDENLMDNPLNHLRRIDLQPNAIIPAAVENVLRMSPNLEEIHNIPVVMFDTLVATKKSGCVKSLVYPLGTREEKFKTGFETLASLELKLQSFDFDSYRRPQESLCNAMYHPFVRMIFQSSHDSMQSLTLSESESFDFEAIPPMTSLEEVTLLLMFETHGVIKFFAPHVGLHRLFPNVSALKILLSMNDNPITDITTYFPENQFTPWGSQIKSLSLLDAPPQTLEQLSRLFPCIKNLEFRIQGKPKDLLLMLKAVGQCWPKIEDLTVVVAYCYYSCSRSVKGRKQLTLDSAFTGIPDDGLAQLKDPVSRNDYFSWDEVQSFKQASTVRKLSELKVLKFDLTDRMTGCGFMEKLAVVTSVSKEFGFQFLPELKIVVWTEDDKLPEVSHMKSSLGSLVKFEDERRR